MVQSFPSWSFERSAGRAETWERLIPWWSVWLQPQARFDSTGNSIKVSSSRLHIGNIGHNPVDEDIITAHHSWEINPCVTHSNTHNHWVLINDWERLLLIPWTKSNIFDQWFQKKTIIHDLTIKLQHKDNDLKIWGLYWSWSRQWKCLFVWNWNFFWLLAKNIIIWNPVTRNGIFIFRANSWYGYGSHNQDPIKEGR